MRLSAGLAPVGAVGVGGFRSVIRVVDNVLVFILENPTGVYRRLHNRSIILL